MGIFTRTKEDSVFGEMKFHRTFGFIGSGFWDGEVMFTPIGRVVKIRMAARRNGISERQRTFFKEIEKRYPELSDLISNVLVDTPLNYFGPNFFGNVMPKPEWQDFELDSIGIGQSGQGDLEWNLSYRYLPMADTYSVNFEGWKPIYGELDD